MRSMTVWSSPWSVLDTLGRLNGPFGGFMDGRELDECGYRPRMDIWGDEERIVVDVELPGVDPKDVSISVEDDEITIAGEVKPEAVDESVSVYSRERPSGKFSRKVRTPFGVDADKVEAACRNGVLRISVPRAEASKPRRIEIKAA